MTDLIFFYGTLLGSLNSPMRSKVDSRLTLQGRGTIAAALFDFGSYPGAVSDPSSRIVGELLRMRDPQLVLAALDEFEAFDQAKPDESLYTRVEVSVSLDDGRLATAWAYFYNRPVASARRIDSGDYLEYLKAKPQRERSD